MRTDLEKSQENGWERSSNFVRQQSAEEVVNKRTKSSSARRKTDGKRPSKNGLDRDKKILIIGVVAVLLVIILIFSAGKSWQRRTDKKEIDTLSRLNAELKAQVADLEKDNTELQKTVSSMKTETQSTGNSTGKTSGKTHVLQTAYNFRAEPNVDSDVVLELDEGTTVTIVKELEDGWVQAQCNGENGYLKCGDELTGSSNSQNGNTTGNTGSDADSNEDSNADSNEDSNDGQDDEDSGEA